MTPASEQSTQWMRAIEIREPGGPEVLQPTLRPLPEPGPGEVRVRVMAAGVNRPDCLQRQGRYPPPPGTTDIPGLEIAGWVHACGPDVDGVKVGDRVCALVAGGGYAEYCLSPVGQCLPIPDGLDFIEAAALPETWFTVWTNLIDRAHLTGGETVLVHGGASGIGSTAIQIAKALGARVLTTVGSAEKAAGIVDLGADLVINYREQNFREAIVAAQGGKTDVDVILDIVGGPYLEDNLKLLNPDGRLVVIGILGGSIGQLDLGRLLFKRLTVTGSTLRARSVAEKTTIRDALLARAWPDLATGRTRPLIDRTEPLENASAAHARMESNAVIGKIVLRVADETGATLSDAP